LLLAVTATAMRSRLDRIMELGWRAAVPVVAATLLSFATSLAYAAVLID
jgi:NADH:ubiquinone oxidoreductase subunit H